jgi:NTE family protein
MMKIGLALAGGGARGIAHIGILAALAKHSVPVHHLAGTSSGAIIGAMYASRPEPVWVEKRFREFLDSAAFRALGTERLARHHREPESLSPFGKRLKNHFAVNLSLMKTFIIPRETLNNAIEFLVPARRFEDLALPMTITATELQRGTTVIYESGDLVQALANSASIPGVMEPEISSDSIVVDGGVLCPVPAECLRDQVDFVMASEISRRGLPAMGDINIYALMMRSEQLSQRALAHYQSRTADFAFCPDVMSLHWSQFGAVEVLIANGQAEAEGRMGELKKRIRQAGNPLHRLRRFLNRPIG